MQDKDVIRILLVEEKEELCSRTKDVISQIPGKKFHVDCVYSFEEALQKLKSNAYTLYFIEDKLGDKKGMDLLATAIEQGCDAPIVMLSTLGNKEMDMHAIEIGAYDYIIKSEINIENLERCIRYSLERAKNFRDVKDNERKYRSIFEKAKDIVFIATEDHKIIDINYAVTELLQFDQEELLLNELSILFRNQTDFKLFVKILDEFGEFSGFQSDILTKGGDVKNCILSASYEINNEGITYLQGIIHDNTSRRRSEKSMLQTEKLAATSRLVRTLAHEVRNPLNNINLSIEQLMQLVEGNEDSKVYLDIILRNSNRIGDLITELLSSSRMNMKMNLVKASLQNVLDKAVESAIDRLTLKNINLQISYPLRQAIIYMDVEKLQLAFLNIIINAIEAMKEGEGKLTISINNEKNEFLVIIKDNGCGISEENLQKLYEPYFTSKRNGMGLGLANTINIIQSHNAQIDVESIVGKGTSFIVRFNKIN